MTDDEREDREALRWYVPAVAKHVERVKAARSSEAGGLVVKVQASGVDVTVNGSSANGHEPLWASPQPTGARMLAAHRSTRYALSLRRQAANRARVARGLAQLPGIHAGDCPACEGWGVCGVDRHRCERCNGSGDR